MRPRLPVPTLCAVTLFGACSDGSGVGALVGTLPHMQAERLEIADCRADWEKTMALSREFEGEELDDARERFFREADHAAAIVRLRCRLRRRAGILI